MAPTKSILFKAWDARRPLRDEMIAFLRAKFSLDVPGAKSNGTQEIVDELRGAYLLPQKDWRDY